MGYAQCYDLLANYTCCNQSTWWVLGQRAQLIRAVSGGGGTVGIVQDDRGALPTIMNRVTFLTPARTVIADEKKLREKQEQEEKAEREKELRRRRGLVGGEEDEEEDMSKLDITVDQFLRRLCLEKYAPAFRNALVTPQHDCYSLVVVFA